MRVRLGQHLRRSWPLYVGLFATWVMLLALNLGAPRSGSTGFHFDVPAYAWWLTQCEVLLMYLKLAIWPAPLLCHYRLPYLMSFGEAWPYVLPVLALAVFTLVLLAAQHSGRFSADVCGGGPRTNVRRADSDGDGRRATDVFAAGVLADARACRRLLADL